MHLDSAFASPGSRARVLAVTAMIVGLALPMACTQGGSGSGCVAYGSGIDFDFDDSITVGFDDTASTVAMMGVAIDDNGVMGAPASALVIALQFPRSVNVIRDFSPTCDTVIAIDSYTYGVTDATPQIAFLATAFPFIDPALTDTAGVEGMDHSMNALLTIDSSPNDRYFLAVSGTITVNRRDPTSPALATVTGDLTFVELDGASTTADILVGGSVLRIDDINFDWDTTVQP